jgi:hypothetical protein
MKGKKRKPARLRGAWRVNKKEVYNGSPLVYHRVVDVKNIVVVCQDIKED